MDGTRWGWLAGLSWDGLSWDGIVWLLFGIEF
jgi:hypothetical protein